jgi:hypothetical protein
MFINTECRARDALKVYGLETLGFWNHGLESRKRLVCTPVSYFLCVVICMMDQFLR